MLLDMLTFDHSEQWTWTVVGEPIFILSVEINVKNLSQEYNIYAKIRNSKIIRVSSL